MAELKPDAWIKEWVVDGKHRYRVDLHPEPAPWMSAYQVKVTPLYGYRSSTASGAADK